MNNDVYKFDHDQGCLVKAISNPEEMWCVFVYTSKHEDINIIYGKAPLQFEYKQLTEYLYSPEGKSDMEYWLSQGFCVVIRKVLLEKE